MENSVSPSLLLRLLMDLLQDVPMEREERNVSNARWWISLREKDLMKKLSTTRWMCWQYTSSLTSSKVDIKNLILFLLRAVCDDCGGIREGEKAGKSLQVTIIVYSSYDKVYGILDRIGILLDKKTTSGNIADYFILFVSKIYVMFFVNKHTSNLLI